MLSGLFHRMLVHRELDPWLTDNYLRAAEALFELALELEAKTARDIGARQRASKARVTSLP